MDIYQVPNDVTSLLWLSELLGVSRNTVYRLAASGDLDDFGVFRLGRSYRVSKPLALRRLRGSDPVPAAVSR
jgi:excisionase family DNA binding protein